MRNRIGISRRVTFAVLTVGVLAFVSFLVTACATTSAASPQAGGSQPATAQSQPKPSAGSGGSANSGAGVSNSTPSSSGTSTPTSGGASVPSSSSSSVPAGGNPGSGAKVTKSNSGGSVTIDATWQNGQSADKVVFAIQMNTHSVDLDGYDLGKLVSLRNEKGQEVKAERWESAPGGHHRSGVLTFPLKDSSGNPILGAKALELVIRDVAGVKERVLRWEIN